jgi:hypothetical protein
MIEVIAQEVNCKEVEDSVLKGRREVCSPYVCDPVANALCPVLRPGLPAERVSIDVIKAPQLPPIHIYVSRSSYSLPSSHTTNIVQNRQP